MCVMQADQFTGSIRNIRDNVNAVTGWGNPGTRGEQSAPNVTIYNQLPGGDIAKAGEPVPNKSALKTKPPSKGGAY